MVRGDGERWNGQSINFNVDIYENRNLRDGNHAEYSGASQRHEPQGLFHLRRSFRPPLFGMTPRGKVTHFPNIVS